MKRPDLHGNVVASSPHTIRTCSSPVGEAQTGRPAKDIIGFGLHKRESRLCTPHADGSPVWQLDERRALLWATGFKPTVLSYDGWEVPVPLSIELQHGEADLRQIAEDIYALTKLNYNACKLGDASPVTIGFSDQVGEILIGNPKIKVRLPSFRFYI
jgi:Predicted membrane protein